MNHLVDMCPLTKFDGGLNLLHEADDNAVIWLESTATAALTKWNELLGEKRHVYVNDLCRVAAWQWNVRDQTGDWLLLSSAPACCIILRHDIISLVVITSVSKEVMKLLEFDYLSVNRITLKLCGWFFMTLGGVLFVTWNKQFGFTVGWSVCGVSELNVHKF